MNNKLKLPVLLLATVCTIGLVIPQTATARDRHADDRGGPPKFAHHDRSHHQYRQQRRHSRFQQHRPAPRWYRRYQRSHGYGQHYRPWRKHPGLFMDRHGLKQHYRRMERQQRHHGRYGRSPYGGYSDSNIHFRIDYWN